MFNLNNDNSTKYTIIAPFSINEDLYYQNFQSNLALYQKDLLIHKLALDDFQFTYKCENSFNFSSSVGLTVINSSKLK